MPRRCVPIFVLILYLALPALAAKKPSRVEGTILDEKGEPVAGVTIVVTSPGDPEARVELSSNRKGKFEVDFADTRNEYLWSFQKEGHEPLITTVEIVAGKKNQIDITLPSDTGEAAQKRRALRLYNEGVGAFNEGDKDRAKDLFQQASEADPTLAQARVALAEASFQTDDPARALTAARAALIMDPENLEAKRLVLQAAQKLGDWDTMETAADSLKGSELAGSVAVSVFNEGVAALDGGDRDRAVRHFEQAAAIDGALAPPHSALATIKFNRQDYRGALESLDRFLELKPGDVESLRLRFLAADALGDETLTAEARAAYEAAAPERAAAESYDQAEALFKANRLDEAQEILEGILDADPDHVRANYTLGLCLLNGGDTAGAKRQLQKVIDLAPDSQQGRDAKEMLQFI